MAIANPRVHVICGICGNSKMMKYRVKKETNDVTNKEYQSVTLICENCSSLTALDELMKEDESKYKVDRVE